MSPDRRRWFVLALVFVATVLNYVDRQTLSVLSTTLRTEIGLGEHDYANVVSAFLLAYTLMYTVSGFLIDRLGAKLGVMLCVAWWSLATMLSGTVSTPGGLMRSRFLLGLGEPGIFPGGVKVCAEWFSAILRATATGIFSSGVSVGALLAAPLVATLTALGGWRWAFFIPGLLGLVWLPVWWRVYRQAPVRANESRAARGRPWRERLRDRRLWALVIPRLASDPVWYLYLFWLPDYLQRVRHLSLAEIGLYAWIPFVFADLGNVLGGAASDALTRRGWSAPRARVAVLLAVAAVAPLGALVGYTKHTATAIAVTCMITFLCQVWATNIATLAAEFAGPGEQGSWVGMMGTSGSLGGMLFAQFLGWSIGRFGYASAFASAAVLHPLAAAVLLIGLRGESTLRRPGR